MGSGHSSSWLPHYLFSPVLPGETTKSVTVAFPGRGRCLVCEVDVGQPLDRALSGWTVDARWYKKDGGLSSLSLSVFICVPVIVVHQSRPSADVRSTADIRASTHRREHDWQLNGR